MPLAIAGICSRAGVRRRVPSAQSRAEFARRYRRSFHSSPHRRPRDENDVVAIEIRELMAAGGVDGPSAIAQLRHADPYIRSLAAQYLGWLRYMSAVPSLLRVLCDTNECEDVRSAAGTSLGHMRAQKAVDRLVRVVAGAADPVGRRWAIYALGYLSGPGVYAGLLRILRGHGEDPAMRAQAAQALGTYSAEHGCVLQNVELRHGLESVLELDSFEAKRAALYALGNCNCRGTIGILKRWKSADQSAPDGLWTLAYTARKSLVSFRRRRRERVRSGR